MCLLCEQTLCAAHNSFSLLQRLRTPNLSPTSSDNLRPLNRLTICFSVINGFVYTLMVPCSLWNYLYQYLSYETALWCSCSYWRSQSLCSRFLTLGTNSSMRFSRPELQIASTECCIWHERPCMCRHTDGSCPPFSSAHADLSSSDDPTSSHRPGTPWSNCGTEVSPGWAAIHYLSTRGSCHHRPGSKEKSVKKKREGGRARVISISLFWVAPQTEDYIDILCLVLARLLSLENQSKGKTCTVFIILTFHNSELSATLLPIAILIIFNLVCYLCKM